MRKIKSRKKVKHPRSKSAKKLKERHPDKSFAFLRDFLNNKNLDSLLCICAGLCCYNNFSPDLERWSIKKWINYPQNRIFLFAVLESKSSSDKSSQLSKRNLVIALSNALDAIYNPRALDILKQLSGKPGVELEFHRFFSLMGNIQIAHREHNPIVSAGRTAAMLEGLPVSKRSWLSKETIERANKLAPQCERADYKWSIIGIELHEKSKHFIHFKLGTYSSKGEADKAFCIKKELKDFWSDGYAGAYDLT